MIESVPHSSYYRHRLNIYEKLHILLMLGVYLNGVVVVLSILRLVWPLAYDVCLSILHPNFYIIDMVSYQ